jgi:tripeptide aminopeptidase
MYNGDMALDYFLKICTIPSPSLHERKLAMKLERDFRKLGCACLYDKAAAKIMGEVGNLIIRVPGNKYAGKSPGRVLVAHMDTVSPCDGIQPTIIGRQKVISSGKTILGADCKAGIAIIYAIVKSLKISNANYKPFEILFTVSEEAGLLGSQNLDANLLKGRLAIILDSDSKGLIHYEAPGADRFRINIHGKSAHSGTSFWKGINAIVVAAKIINAIPMEDQVSGITINVASINGGGQFNIVPERAAVSIEIRSTDSNRMKNLRSDIRDIVEGECKTATTKYGAPTFEIEQVQSYPPLKQSSKPKEFSLLEKSFNKIGARLKIKPFPGGFDGNQLMRFGFQSTNLPNGSREIHSTNEYLDLSEFYKIGRGLYQFFTEVM